MSSSSPQPPPSRETPSSSSSVSLSDDETLNEDGTPKTEPKMVWPPIIALSAGRLSEAVAMTSVFPYIPEMARLMGVPENDVGKWAGAVASVFSLTQFFSTMFWTRLAERVGRKPIMLLGLIVTAICNVGWGLSTNMAMAIMARSASGLFNGNTPIYKTVIGELVPEVELQALAFSVLPAVFHFGATIGPWIGSSTANIRNRQPGQPSDGTLFSSFPFLLPSLIVSLITVSGVGLTYLFTPETHPTLRHRRDNGIEMGKKIEHKIHTAAYRFERIFRTNGYFQLPEELDTTPKEAQHVPSYPLIPFKDVLNPQTCLNIAGHAFMALHTVAILDILPTFMHRSVQKPDESDPNGNDWYRFSGGLGFSTSVIGYYFATAAVFTVFFQMMVYPKYIASRFSPSTLYRGSMWAFPFLYLLFPLTVLVPKTYYLQHGYLMSLWLIKCIVEAVSFPTGQIMLKNASTTQSIATLNAINTLAVCAGRSIGPFSTGYIFSWGVRHGLGIAAFLYIAVMGVMSGLISLMVKFTDEKKKPVVVTPSANTDEENATENSPLLGRRS